MDREKRSLFFFVKVLIIAGTLELSGCASGPNGIEAVQVGKAVYADLSCEDLKRKIDGTLANISDLHNSLSNAAGDDSAQLAISALFFWPTVFLLEGGNGGDSDKYARLKGDAIALRATAFDKNCDFTNPVNKEIR